MFINQENLATVKSILDREKKGNGAVGYTNDEIVLLVKAFRDLIDIGNLLGLEMLSAWAVSQYSHFTNVFWARGIDSKLIRPAEETNWSPPPPLGPRPTLGVSPSWVLSLFAGMKFIRRDGNRDPADACRPKSPDLDAYDYVKERLIREGHKV